jgi:hypothetical protein
LIENFQAGFDFDISSVIGIVIEIVGRSDQDLIFLNQTLRRNDP